MHKWILPGCASRPANWNDKGVWRMTLGMRFLRGALVAALIGVGLPMISVVATTAVSTAASAQTIVVEGNRRVEADTIRSYFKRGPGGAIGRPELDNALKALFETGLFQDVRITPAAGRIVVVVVENQVINRIAFEGNKKVKDEQLLAEIQSKPRGALSKPAVQADTSRITEIYRRNGRFDVRVEPKIIERPNNRVDLVFEITEGPKTGVKIIRFEGNRAFSEYRLKDVIKTNETNLLSFLGSGDVYDPDRVEADRDLIRRYYLKNGYADVRVIAAVAEYDPGRKGFIVTFKIDEGGQYRVRNIDVQSNVRNLDPAALRPYLRLSSGSVYNGEKLEKSVEEMSIEASRRGFAFVQVRPRGDRNFESLTVDIVLVVDEGPRAYVERINVRGNNRTRDYVIRREFDIAEGDAYNRALVDRAERRLRNLDFFKAVKITAEPGSSQDRVVLNVDVDEKSTGDFSVSGGYSTSDGFMGEISVQERNLLGMGLYARAALQYGQNASGYTLSFVEPYLLGYRIAWGLDVFQRTQKASSTVSYETRTAGFGTKLGFTLREDLTLLVRYNYQQQQIKLPDVWNDCFTYLPSSGRNMSGTGNCYVNGEASLPVRIDLLRGKAVTSAVGYTLTYNTLDDNKNPTEGILAEFRQDFAGLGGDVRFVKSAADARYYFPVISDVVGIVHGQAGNLASFDNSQLRFLDHYQMGPNLVRGFAANGMGPRDMTPGSTQDALGGTNYWGASVELQMPFWFLPKEVGLKGAVFADAGSLWDYRGPTAYAPSAESILLNGTGNTIRSSVGASIIWKSPLGPLRFDYAVATSKAAGDKTQEFRFGGGTSF